MATKITFTLSPEVVGNATSGILLGEFNNWDYSEGIELKKQKDGSLKTVVSLEPGKSYQYRYLLNDGRWVNDQQAQDYVHISGFQIENCIINVPAEEPEAPAKAAPVAEEAPKAEAKPKAKAKAKAPAAEAPAPVVETPVEEKAAPKKAKAAPKAPAAKAAPKAKK